MLWAIIEAAFAMSVIVLTVLLVAWVGEKHAQTVDVFAVMDRLLGQEREASARLYSTTGRDVAAVPLKAPATLARPGARPIEGKFDEHRT